MRIVDAMRARAGRRSGHRARGAHVAGIALLALLAAPAHAQDARAATGATDASAADAFCWRGRPLPHCRAFALFELGYFEAPVTTRIRETVPPPFSYERDEILFSRQLSWSVGAMRNVDARTALGGAVVIGAALEQGPFVAGTARWRRWTGTRTSVELAGGPGVAQVLTPYAGTPSGNQGDVWRPAALAEARANLADLAALSVRGLVVPRVAGRTQGAVFVGASTGSTGAAVGTLGLAALFALAIAALGNAS
jgi:hypothetical protein